MTALDLLQRMPEKSLSPWTANLVSFRGPDGTVYVQPRFVQAVGPMEPREGHTCVRLYLSYGQLLVRWEQ